MRYYRGSRGRAVSPARSEGRQERNMQPTPLIRTFRAVRHFAEQPVPREVLDDILEAARWTGSSKNSQPWELVVVADHGILQQLARLGQYADLLAGAQCAIVLGYPADAQARKLSGSPPGTRSVVSIGRKPLAELVSWERYGLHEPARDGGDQG